MFTLLIVFVVVLALFALLSLVGGGPGFGRRRGRTIIIERDAPRERIVERRVVERPTVVEREYDV
jgi:hypothetical protein